MLHDINLVTSKITTNVDDKDWFIHNQIMMLFNHHNAETIVKFVNDEKAWHKFHTAMVNASISLYKANAHRRNYHRILPESRKWAKEEIDKSSATDSQVYPWDLLIETEGVLIQCKSALDSLAIAIGAFYGVPIDAFHKKKDKKDGNTYSGQTILNTLNNLPADKKKMAETLIDFLERAKPVITKYVETRDLFNHPKNKFSDVVSGFYYVKKEDELRDPIVGHGKNPEKSYFQAQYINEAYDFFSKFVSDCLASILGSAIPGLGFKINDKDDSHRYTWSP